MPSPDKDAFIQVWPKFVVIGLAIIEILCIAFLILTELGNVAANFWITNVFAGDWCALVMIIHVLALFSTIWITPGPKAAFVSVIITIVALLTCALLISFNGVFIAQPSTCILTSSCAANSVSTTVFTYNLQTNFFTTFNRLGAFTTYTQTQAKLLFHAIQIGVGCLCFVTCTIYLIIYYVSKRKASNRIRAITPEDGYGAPQPKYKTPSPSDDQRPTPNNHQQPRRSYRQEPRVPQPPPGEIPWNGKRKF